MQKLRFALSTLIAGVLVLGLAACAPAKIDMTNVTGIIDTRPSAEFYKEHIIGATNIDYSTGDFIALTSPYVKTGKYLVYGSTAEEATAAVQAMFDRGFVDVTNVGDYANAKSLIPLTVVKDSYK